MIEIILFRGGMVSMPPLLLIGFAIPVRLTGHPMKIQDNRILFKIIAYLCVLVLRKKPAV